jgi:hypothetical protein
MSDEITTKQELNQLTMKDIERVYRQEYLYRVALESVVSATKQSVLTATKQS